jgi:hypothetical protein
MSSDRETTRIVRSWLEEGVTTLPDRVLDRVLDQLPQTQQRRRWWPARRHSLMSNTFKGAMAGLAALAVAFVGIGLYFNQPSMVGPAPSPESTPTLAPTLPPTPAPTPEAAAPLEIVEAYIEARNAYDPERARELLAESFTTGEPPDGYRDLSNLELAFDTHRAWGFQHSLGDCRESEQAARPETVVLECDSLWTTEVHLRGDLPPTPETFQFRIRDGRITSVTHDAPHIAWYFGPRSFYDDFLSEHLEFRRVIDKHHNLDPEATREVIERLPEYFELYEEWISQQP